MNNFGFILGMFAFAAAVAVGAELLVEKPGSARVQNPREESLASLAPDMPAMPGIDHGDFGLNQSKVMNVIDSNSGEGVAGGKPGATSSHPAPGAGPASPAEGQAYVEEAGAASPEPKGPDENLPAPKPEDQGRLSMTADLPSPFGETRTEMTLEPRTEAPAATSTSDARLDDLDDLVTSSIDKGQARTEAPLPPSSQSRPARPHKVDGAGPDVIRPRIKPELKSEPAPPPAASRHKAVTPAKPRVASTTPPVPEKAARRRTSRLAKPAQDLDERQAKAFVQSVMTARPSGIGFSISGDLCHGTLSVHR